MPKSAALDVIVYGATGYTGQLVAEAMARRSAAGDGFTWAMAGRNTAKLDAVRAALGLGDSVALITADGDDADSLMAMAGQAKVVLTTVGPYQLYGEKLVAACAEIGTDYVDLCGEPAWMAQMIPAHQAQAQSSGARIVFSCGFDSIPFDLGVFALQKEAVARFGAPCREVRGRVRTMVGAFSGGTAASLKATMAAAMRDPSVIMALRSPFALTPGFVGPDQPDGASVQHDEGLGMWVAPFIMAPINTKNVHRSNALLGHMYGADFLYSEMLVTGPGEKGEAMARHLANDNALMSADGPKPGEGPSKEEREAGHFDVLFIGVTANGRSLKLGVTGDMDPGYGSTSKMITEAALCLAQDAIAAPGGIYTPTPALGDRLIARLKAHAGLTFAIED